jgi:hypothetical protein
VARILVAARHAREEAGAHQECNQDASFQFEHFSLLLRRLFTLGTLYHLLSSITIRKIDHSTKKSKKAFFGLGPAPMPAQEAEPHCFKTMSQCK